MNITRARAKAFANSTAYCFSTPLGSMTAFGTDEALLGLAFKNELNPKNPTHRFLMIQESQLPQRKNDLLADLEKAIYDYCSGKIDQIEVPYQLFGTAFQIEAWEALQKIPIGQTITYQEQATWIGRPKAARAVGQANRMNFLPLLLPCHRVLSPQAPHHYAGSCIAKVHSI